MLLSCSCVPCRCDLYAMSLYILVSTVFVNMRAKSPYENRQVCEKLEHKQSESVLNPRWLCVYTSEHAYSCIVYACMCIFYFGTKTHIHMPSITMHEAESHTSARLQVLRQIVTYMHIMRVCG